MACRLDFQTQKLVSTSLVNQVLALGSQVPRRVYLAHDADTETPVRLIQAGDRPCCHTRQAGSADMQDTEVTGSQRLPPDFKGIPGRPGLV